MTRGVPLDPELREAIAEDMRRTLGTPDGALRRVAERHGVSMGAVRNVRNDYGLIGAPEARAKMQNATEAMQSSNAERRATIAKSLLRVAEEAIADMDRPCTIFNFGGKDNTYTERKVTRPPFADRRQLATIAAIAIDKHVVIDKHDAELGAGSDFERFQQWLAGAPPHTHES